MTNSSSRLLSLSVFHIVLLLQALPSSTAAGNVHRRVSSWSLPSKSKQLPVVSLHVAPSVTVSSSSCSASLRGGDLTPAEDNDLSTDSACSSESVEQQQQVVTVEAYVAAMEEKDAVHRSLFDSDASMKATAETKDDDIDDDKDDNDDDSRQNSDREAPGDAAPTAEETAAVGVKSHNSNNSNKKSNAVGDPDGEGSDDSDDDTDDWEDSAMDIFEQANGELEDMDLIPDDDQKVQVELELMEANQEHVDVGDEANSEEESEEGSSSAADATTRGGGVGLRLAGRLNRRKHRNAKDWRSSSSGSGSNTQATKTTVSPEELLEAWQPHVYLPPTASALKYLTEHARSIDGASKTRLDRRTMYAGLLLEWRNSNGSTSGARKFLEQPISQALQAALSLATQPAWRKSFPRPSGIRLYDNDNEQGRDSTEHKGCATLAMQETIAMALAHSLGAGMVILDDATLSGIRQDMLRKGHSEESVKPAVLIQSLLAMARQGKLKGLVGGSISKCMERDLSVGLDDPYDERAAASCQDMSTWEQKWVAMEEENGAGAKTGKEEALPLVIFLRPQASTSLLKSKSVVEVLMRECNAQSHSDGINLVILGKGIDSKTKRLPQEPVQETTHHEMGAPQDLQQSNVAGGAPWFGFSPHNQNASGQNDPEGSRRFNIFLARTVDPSGAAGVLGAIAPPQAGNLFPHMMAMQARDRLQQADDDSPVKAELERWAQLLQQQMQTNGGQPLPPPQFFNVSMSAAPNESEGLPPNTQPPSPEVLQQTLQQAMSVLLDRLAQMNDDSPGTAELSPDLHKAFAQVLRNDNLRKGIAENLARAAPALSDPKCQGVMLSVYVPPPPTHMNRGKLPGGPNAKPQPNNMGGWFQKILNNQEEAENEMADDDGRRKDSKTKRVRTMAAAAAVVAAKNAQDAQANTKKQENKADRNLAKLESLCRPIVVKTPTDPVRAKAWDGWIGRERGSVTFRQNRRALIEQLETHYLSLQEHTGTRGAGSALRQMLSVKDVSGEMGDVMKCAIELEAAKSQRQHESPDKMHESEMDLNIDITLSQLLLTKDGLVENMEEFGVSAARASADDKKKPKPGLQFLHPSSLEAALSRVCRISPSPSGGLSSYSAPTTHRSKDEIAALAQDKHERALVSQVASPQDIGVTYDMIGGLTEVKELLRQSITYPLKFPHLYSEGIAREAVKGVLLFGPPGTGKTMLAKAVATEGGASFLSVDASSVENKWLGESEKNAKAVFTLARRLAPCVIFIDEVDSLLSSREGSSDDSAHGTLTSVKTTMMSEWDGLNSGTNGSGEAGSDRVVVIGSTNRPFDLDEAVLRRFPRRILVDLPDLETRTEILEVTLAENRLDQSVNLTQIADRLEGYTGSDIKEVCREAVVQISHEQAKLLDQGFINSREDVTQGSLQRLRPVTAEDFEKALNKLKRSVSEKGKELARVWEWNDEYGEIKREDKKNHMPHLASMYL